MAPQVGGPRNVPMAFTEHGVIMLASVLNSERAIQVNIQIVRVFTRMREILTSHKELVIKFERIAKKLSEHDDQFLVIFEYLKKLEQAKHQIQEQQNRKRVSFKRLDED